MTAQRPGTGIGGRGWRVWTLEGPPEGECPVLRLPEERTVKRLPTDLGWYLVPTGAQWILVE